MSSVLDSRVTRIIRWLLNQDEPRSTASVAADLGLSPRVVRYRLGAAEAYLRSQGATLTRRRGAGLLLEADEELRSTIRADLGEGSAGPRVYAPEERESLVLAHLLWTAPDHTSVDELQEVLEVSKASARRDLQRVEPWLERRGLPLVRRPGVGVGVVGSELAIRQAMVQLTLEAVPEDVINDLCRGGYAASTLARVKLPAGIREQLRTLPLKTCSRLVADSRIAWTIAQGNSELVFAIYLAVTAARLTEGKTITMDTGQQRSLIDHPVSETAGEIALAFSEALDLEVVEQEVAGITEYLLGLATLGSSPPADDPSHAGLLDELLAIAGEHLHPTLRDDSELRRGLGLHLERLAVRIRYGLPVHNPLLREVEERYPEVFQVAQRLGSVLGAHLSCHIAEDEVGYLTMYLSGAMERSRLTPTRRALVVCPSGMATVWVLVSRIQAEFPQLEIASVVSARGIWDRLEDEIDVVISTVPVEASDVPVVVVSPLLTTDDVRKLGTYI